MLGSSVRMVPAAALRGLAAGAMPEATRSSFICSKALLREDDFAADFEALRQMRGFELCGADVKGDAADGADVRSHILTCGPVAARDASGEDGFAVFARDVLEGEREAVELELADEARIFV